MKVGVVTFPGSLDDVDAARAARIAVPECDRLVATQHDRPAGVDVVEGARKGDHPDLH